MLMGISKDVCSIETVDVIYFFKEVYPAEDLHLIVVFENGKVKDYDVKQLFDRFSDYKALRNPDIFNPVHVDCGGCCVAWNDELDISECELWEGAVDR